MNKKEEKPKWLYEATIVKVKDGDTLACDINLASFNQLQEIKSEDDLIDLGFSVFVSQSFLPLILAGSGLWLADESIRFFGLNAPEKSTDKGKEVAKFVEGLCAIGSVVTLETIRVKSKTKQEKYGRYLGKIFFPDGRCLNDILLAEGLAVPMLF
jgi:endonuclease YncB( thermonuclease family)